MSAERTRVERYSASSYAAKPRSRRHPPRGGGSRIPLLDQKLRAKRAAKRARRLRKGKGLRPEGRRPAKIQSEKARKERNRSRRQRTLLRIARALRPPPASDPRFDTAKLTIELVPRPLWYASNIRSIVPTQDWDLLRRVVYRRASYLCEICGGRGPNHPIECHEVWRYDEATRTQVLERMIGLCPACHGVKHMGRSQTVGKGDEALAHLASVNGWPPDLARRYVDLAFFVWGKRSSLSDWKLIVNWDALASDYEVPLSLHGTIEYPAKSTEAPTPGARSDTASSAAPSGSRPSRSASPPSPEGD